MHVYGTRDLQRLLGIGPSAVRSLIRAGHVKPRKGARGRLQFTFQDLIVLRTARSLSGANVPTRRLNRCLKQLRDALPADVPLSGLSITAVGDQIAVREGRQQWDTESQQYLLALEVVMDSGEVQMIARDPAVLNYENAQQNEEMDPAAAIAAYLRCIHVNKDHLDARINCGRLLHLSGRLEAAERIYRAAPEPDAVLLFNLAVLLEDLGREAQAIEVYQQALELDPALADAHFNLSRLYELAGNRRDSFRHLLAYKRASEQ